MEYLFKSESVSEGHPDKIYDQISDAILDEYLRHNDYKKYGYVYFTWESTNDKKLFQ